MGRNEACSIINSESTKQTQLASVYTKSHSFIGTQSSVWSDVILRVHRIEIKCCCPVLEDISRRFIALTLESVGWEGDRKMKEMAVDGSPRK